MAASNPKKKVTNKGADGSEKGDGKKKGSSSVDGKSVKASKEYVSLNNILRKSDCCVIFHIFAYLIILVS